jgi:hypothetical protein
MTRSIAIHCVTRFPHQLLSGNAMLAGMLAHGEQGAFITDDPHAAADWHVVLSNGYLKHWRDHDRCIWLDRCFYGHHRTSWSIAWLKNGIRQWQRDCPDGRPLPPMAPWREDGRALLLVDYEDDPPPVLDARAKALDAKRRYHPRDKRACPCQPGLLEDALAGIAVALGHTTTAMSAAALAGVALVTSDRDAMHAEIAAAPDEPIRRPDRTQWRRNLSWANWNEEEVARGDAWAYLLERELLL